jgi:hypothetical protein
MAGDIITFLSGSMINLTGSSILVTLPSDTRSVMFRAEGGAVYFEINTSTGSASTMSSGYVPQDGKDFIPDICNIKTLHVFGSLGVKAHLQYFA